VSGVAIRKHPKIIKIDVKCVRKLPKRTRNTYVKCDHQETSPKKSKQISRVAIIKYPKRSIPEFRGDNQERS
jgi:hypothetical protein